MLGDRQAIIRVVSALRSYRAAVDALLSARYEDGFSDGVAAAKLESAASYIEGTDD